MANWIKSATENAHGQFAAKAKRAGMSTQAYADREKNAPGKTGKQARLALTLGKMRKKKASSSSESKRYSKD